MSQFLQALLRNTVILLYYLSWRTWVATALEWVIAGNLRRRLAISSAIHLTPERKKKSRGQNPCSGLCCCFLLEVLDEHFVVGPCLAGSRFLALADKAPDPSHHALHNGGNAADGRSYRVLHGRSRYVHALHGARSEHIHPVGLVARYFG